MGNNQINFFGWILFTLPVMGIYSAAIEGVFATVGLVFFLLACAEVISPVLRPVK